MTVQIDSTRNLSYIFTDYQMLQKTEANGSIPRTWTWIGSYYFVSDIL